MAAEAAPAAAPMETSEHRSLIPLPPGVVNIFDLPAPKVDPWTKSPEEAFAKNSMHMVRWIRHNEAAFLEDSTAANERRMHALASITANHHTLKLKYFMLAYTVVWCLRGHREPHLTTFIETVSRTLLFKRGRFKDYASIIHHMLAITQTHIVVELLKTGDVPIAHFLNRKVKPGDSFNHVFVLGGILKLINEPTLPLEITRELALGLIENFVPYDVRVREHYALAAIDGGNSSGSENFDPETFDEIPIKGPKWTAVDADVTTILAAIPKSSVETLASLGAEMEPFIVMAGFKRTAPNRVPSLVHTCLRAIATQPSLAHRSQQPGALPPPQAARVLSMIHAVERLELNPRLAKKKKNKKKDKTKETAKVKTGADKGSSEEAPGPAVHSVDSLNDEELLATITVLDEEDVNALRKREDAIWVSPLRVVPLFRLAPDTAKLNVLAKYYETSIAACKSTIKPYDRALVLAALQYYLDPSITREQITIVSTLFTPSNSHDRGTVRRIAIEWLEGQLYNPSLSPRVYLFLMGLCGNKLENITQVLCSALPRLVAGFDTLSNEAMDALEAIFTMTAAAVQRHPDDAIAFHNSSVWRVLMAGTNAIWTACSRMPLAPTDARGRCLRSCQESSVNLLGDILIDSLLHIHAPTTCPEALQTLSTMMDSLVPLRDQGATKLLYFACTFVKSHIAAMPTDVVIPLFHKPGSLENLVATIFQISRLSPESLAQTELNPVTYFDKNVLESEGVALSLLKHPPLASVVLDRLKTELVLARDQTGPDDESIDLAPAIGVLAMATLNYGRFDPEDELDLTSDEAAMKRTCEQITPLVTQCYTLVGCPLSPEAMSQLTMLIGFDFVRYDSLKTTTGAISKLDHAQFFDIMCQMMAYPSRIVRGRAVDSACTSLLALVNFANGMAADQFRAQARAIPCAPRLAAALMRNSNEMEIHLAAVLSLITLAVHGGDEQQEEQLFVWARNLGETQSAQLTVITAQVMLYVIRTADFPFLRRHAQRILPLLVGNLPVNMDDDDDDKCAAARAEILEAFYQHQLVPPEQLRPISILLLTQVCIEDTPALNALRRDPEIFINPRGAGATEVQEQRLRLHLSDFLHFTTAHAFEKIVTALAPHEVSRREAFLADVIDRMVAVPEQMPRRQVLSAAYLRPVATASALARHEAAYERRPREERKENLLAWIADLEHNQKADYLRVCVLGLCALLEQHEVEFSPPMTKALVNGLVDACNSFEKNKKESKKNKDPQLLTEDPLTVAAKTWTGLNPERQQSLLETLNGHDASEFATMIDIWRIRDTTAVLPLLQLCINAIAKQPDTLQASQITGALPADLAERVLHVSALLAPAAKKKDKHKGKDKGKMPKKEKMAVVAAAVAPPRDPLPAEVALDPEAVVLDDDKPSPKEAARTARVLRAITHQQNTYRRPKAKEKHKDSKADAEGKAGKDNTELKDGETAAKDHPEGDKLKGKERSRHKDKGKSHHRSGKTKDKTKDKAKDTAVTDTAGPAVPEASPEKPSGDKTSEASKAEALLSGEPVDHKLADADGADGSDDEDDNGVVDQY